MEHSYDQWIGMDAVDREGDKLGKVEAIFYDDVSGRPEWVQVKAGVFKGSRLVPLAGARLDEDDKRLVLGCAKDQIDGAPDFAEEGHLDPREEQQLYEHYGFKWDQRGGDHGYGKGWNANRFDAQYPKREVGRIGNVGTERDETTQTVHANAQVEVPVDAQVRLRRYETQRTKQVTVPVTEEHIEVADVQATARPASRKVR